MFTLHKSIVHLFSFSVNITPKINEFTIPEAKIGEEFRLNLMGSDQR